MAEMLPYILLFLLNVFLAACSQVLLKKAAMKHYDSVLKEYLNPTVIIAYALFFGTTVLGVLAYRGIPISLGPVLEATSYLYVTLFGVLIFHEKMTKRKTAGLVLIIAGILVFTLLG